MKAGFRTDTSAVGVVGGLGWPAAGNLFAVILFAKVQAPRQTADRFEEPGRRADQRTLEGRGSRLARAQPFP
jgi:hypothetical protein